MKPTLLLVFIGSFAIVMKATDGCSYNSSTERCSGRCTDEDEVCRRRTIYSSPAKKCACREPKTCFHGSNKVWMRSGAQKQMRDLEIGDEVLTVSGTDGQLKYQPVLVDAHRNPKLLAKFFSIRTEQQEEVTLTGMHYLHTGCSVDGSKMVTAEEVRLGDMLLIYGNGSLSCQPVTSIDTIMDVGIYNPMVASGNIIANNVYATTHNYASPFTAHSSHLLLWPIRMIATIGGTESLLNAYHPHSGMPYWVHFCYATRNALFGSN